MTRLPALITVPHGGDVMPGFLADKIRLPSKDLFDDGDPFTRQIYDVRSHVVEWIDTEIARAFVDLNRAIDDFPPNNPDGVIKSHTCLGIPIYNTELLEESLSKKLIQQFYVPFHDRIKGLLNQSQDIKIAFDCHSMAEIGPKISKDPGSSRPAFCIGNRSGESCPNLIAEMLARCLADSFDLNEKEITLNQPFAGGFITRTYGMNPIPWIQIEMNRIQKSLHSVYKNACPKLTQSLLMSACKSNPPFG